MCNFFSFVTKGDGKPIYFNAEERRALPDDVKVDSHTTIAVTKLKHVHADDKVNKYEYVNNELIVDQINVENDKEKAEAWIIEFVKTDEFLEICLEAVRNNGLALRYVMEQTEAICLEAVRNNGWALRYVKEQNEAICMAAVRNNGGALMYVKEQNEAICLEAVRKNGFALEYVNAKFRHLFE